MLMAGLTRLRASANEMLGSAGAGSENEMSPKREPIVSTGRARRALAAVESAVPYAGGRSYVQAHLAYAQAALGREADARRTAAALAARSGGSTTAGAAAAASDFPPEESEFPGPRRAWPSDSAGTPATARQGHSNGSSPRTP